ncbi:potassium transporter TrkH [Thioclava dalianensis]|uniref:Potassium transporter TrkH n=1 Tax=Thioclava dalianensis TaxID=1185766 RepID=A0A074TMR1_9RHOB|nr:potassium transporter TrkH [Thioclava dalianensis]
MMRLRGLPVSIQLMLVSSLAMYLPATHALITHHHLIARAFFYSGTLFFFVSSLVALANASNPRPRRAGRANLLSMLAVFLILPMMLAVPFYISLPDTSYFNSWWEMVSSLTTTGGSLYEPTRLAGSLHLWRGLVAWLGGFYMLVMAIAVLAPMRLGGFEVFFSGGPSGAPKSGAPAAEGGADTSERVAHYATRIAPAYIAMTGGLWLLLLMAGDTPLTAFIHAMSTLCTSGISPVGGMEGSNSGLVGEFLIFVFLIPALSRRLWPGGGELRASDRRRDDPELRLAAVLILIVPLFLFLRHWIAALEVKMPTNFIAIFDSIWGSLFTSLSFLTTTGFESTAWQEARNWSGLGTPGLILAGLAIIGGGVATTAGGVRLLRVYALLRHGERELDKLIYPTSVAGGGAMARKLRRDGAYISWIFFMLFAISIAAVMMLVSLFGLSFEPATILTIAALSNTGPLAGIAADVPLSWAHLSEPIKAIFALAMVLGRLETLAIIALFNPEFWRG